MFLYRVVVDSENKIQKRLTFVIKHEVSEKGPEKGFEKLLGGELTGISHKVTDPEKKNSSFEALLRAAELFARDAGCNKVCSIKFRDCNFLF